MLQHLQLNLTGRDIKIFALVKQNMEKHAGGPLSNSKMLRTLIKEKWGDMINRSEVTMEQALTIEHE